jgi:hypothetical protein
MQANLPSPELPLAMRFLLLTIGAKNAAADARKIATASKIAARKKVLSVTTNAIVSRTIETAMTTAPKQAATKPTARATVAC